MCGGIGRKMKVSFKEACLLYIALTGLYQKFNLVMVLPFFYKNYWFLKPILLAIKPILFLKYVCIMQMLLQSNAYY